jgi:hypothetical protein
MADILDLLGDNSNNTQSRRRDRGFLGGLKKSTVVENIDNSLKKSQNSNNFMFDVENDKRTLSIDQAPEETTGTFNFGKRRSFMVNISLN